MEDISGRKIEHLSGAINGFENESGDAFSEYTVLHNALPDISLDEVDATVEFLGRKIAMPLMIGSLTGGPDLASGINKNLAVAAQAAKVPLSLGSARIIFREPKTFNSFNVRTLCPDIPLLLNIGLADLGRSFSIEDCRALVENLNADALIFHINPLHEALQVDGNTDFRGLEKNLRRAVEELGCPVIVKEVGHGISRAVFEKLDSIGVHAVDIAGVGGTSWGFIEGRRARSALRAKVCESFSEWGIPTAHIMESLQGLERKCGLIASGGIRSGVVSFKAMCLGANLTAAAAPFLSPAMISAEEVKIELLRFILEFRLAMFATGCRTTAGISSDLLVKLIRQ